MLTIFRAIEDVYLEIKYQFYGKLLHVAVEKLFECQQQRDAEGMKYYNEVCRWLVVERERAFRKRLELKGYI